MSYNYGWYDNGNQTNMVAIVQESPDIRPRIFTSSIASAVAGFSTLVQSLTPISLPIEEVAIGGAQLSYTFNGAAIVNFNIQVPGASAFQETLVDGMRNLQHLQAPSGVRNVSGLSDLNNFKNAIDAYKAAAGPQNAGRFSWYEQNIGNLADGNGEIFVKVSMDRTGFSSGGNQEVIGSSNFSHEVSTTPNSAGSNSTINTTTSANEAISMSPGETLVAIKSVWGTIATVSSVVILAFSVASLFLGVMDSYAAQMAARFLSIAAMILSLIVSTVSLGLAIASLVLLGATFGSLILPAVAFVAAIAALLAWLL